MTPSRQMLSESSDAGQLQYAYDALGNLEPLTLPDQRQLNHLYYGSGHLHQLNLNGRVISDFERATRLLAMLPSTAMPIFLLTFA
ncbi:hypothetical protein [Pseudomonas sp. ANT_J12]|uniref:hypothetical protein n=1 Tax=Pseudomonas sp. ANT_J12 TaxID=2597351 RepID=UPI002114FF09|nr:hypothetical protein [Pseudomonas sp. ANT_J12]